MIVWGTQSAVSSRWWPFSLRCDQEPSEEQISIYAEFLESVEWDDEKARLEMK